MVEGIMPGDRVACGGAGYANHAELVSVPKNLVVPVPDGVSFEEAAFTTIGSIALQGVRLAKPELGETFLVLGLGLIGQITSQILLANGCRVIGYDPDPLKRACAEELGCVAAASSEEVEYLCHSLTAQHGVDGTLICASTQSNQPLQAAGECTRSKGRVVLIGVVGMELSRELFFKKEISFVVSRSYGPGRYDTHYEENGLDYPYDYVRFTEQRNMESFLQLVADKKVQLGPLMTHTFDFSQSINGYSLLDGHNKEHYLGIVLRYADQTSSVQNHVPVQLKKHEGKVNVSCIGCGSYAVSNILPLLKKNDDVALQAVMSSTGKTSQHIAKQFGFSGSVSDVNTICSDATDVVMIMTRHDSHAALTVDALNAGKHVFVEKPVAITLQQFEEVKHALDQNYDSHFMIGFNRRFSPLTTQLKTFFAKRKAPKMIHIRVNAGMIPKEHWIQDPSIGGGRIAGELCHFVDLASALSDALPVSVMAHCIAEPDQCVMTQDNLHVSIQLSDGSVASIIYTSEGSPLMPKEMIEVYSGGYSAVIDDFKKLTLYSANDTKHVKLTKQDKGQKAMLSEFVKHVQQGKTLVSREVLLANSLATLCVIESLANGKEVRCDGVFE